MARDMDGDLDLACHVAEAAGQRLLEVRALHADAGSAALKRLGDAAAQAVIAELLDRHRPSDSVLSEEAVDDPARLSAERVWIVDPLDGTREFSEAPRDDWAVHVALWSEGELRLGAVSLPARGVTFTSTVGRPPQRAAGGPLRLAVSRSRPPAFVTSLADRLGAELVAMGSAGVKAMSVVDGTTDAYVHAGGQFEWDSAAPIAVARARGLHTSRIDGSALAYNQADPTLPDLVICRPEEAERLLTAIATG